MINVVSLSRREEERRLVRTEHLETTVQPRRRMRGGTGTPKRSTSLAIAAESPGSKSAGKTASRIRETDAVPDATQRKAARSISRSRGDGG